MDGLGKALGGGRTALAGVILLHGMVLALLWWITSRETLAPQVPLWQPFSARLVEDRLRDIVPPPPPARPHTPSAAAPRVAPPPRAPILAANPVTPAAATDFVVPAQPAESTSSVGSGAPMSPPGPAPVPVSEPLVGARFDADYLDNPKPPYPGVSRRLKEEGKVLLRVYVSAAGLPEKVEVRQGSGFLRLDEAARETVQRWRFVPARRGSEAVAAWVLVPISFTLQS